MFFMGHLYARFMLICRWRGGRAVRHCLFVCFAVTFAVFLRSDGDAFVNNFQTPPKSAKSEMNFSWKMNPGSFQDGIENTNPDFQTAAASSYEDPNASSAPVLNDDELAGVVTGSAVGAGLLAGAGGAAISKYRKRAKKVAPVASAGGGSKVGNFFRNTWARVTSLTTRNSSPSTFSVYSTVPVEAPGSAGNPRPHDPYRDIAEATDQKKRFSSSGHSTGRVEDVDEASMPVRTPRPTVPPLPFAEMGLSSPQEGASADNTRHSVRSVSSVSVGTSSQRNARGRSMLPPPLPGSVVSRKR